MVCFTWLDIRGAEKGFYKIMGLNFRQILKFKWNTSYIFLMCDIKCDVLHLHF